MQLPTDFGPCVWPCEKSARCVMRHYLRLISLFFSFSWIPLMEIVHCAGPEISWGASPSVRLNTTEWNLITDLLNITGASLWVDMFVRSPLLQFLLIRVEIAILGQSSSTYPPMWEQWPVGLPDLGFDQTKMHNRKHTTWGTFRTDGGLGVGINMERPGVGSGTNPLQNNSLFFFNLHLYKSFEKWTFGSKARHQATQLARGVYSMCAHIGPHNNEIIWQQGFESQILLACVFLDCSLWCGTPLCLMKVRNKAWQPK